MKFEKEQNFLWQIRLRIFVDSHHCIDVEKFNSCNSNAKLDDLNDTIYRLAH